MNLTGSSGREYHVLIAGEPAISSLLREIIKNYLKPRSPLDSLYLYEAEDGNKARAIAAECQVSGHSLDLTIVEVPMPSGERVFDTIGSLLGILPQTKIIALSATTSFLTDYLKRHYGNNLSVTIASSMITSSPFSSLSTTLVGAVKGVLEGSLHA